MFYPPYVVVTPARDEAEHLQRTVESVVAQTTKPARWVIVNDGSSDETGAIADAWAGRYSWISVVHRLDRGCRQAGSGVVDCFYDGLRAVTVAWDYLVKLDADLVLGTDYFSQCLERFQGSPRLGIAGGGIYHAKDGALVLERNPRFHVRGATKMYRRQCWLEIDGLMPVVGWDTIDEVRANMLGWETRTFDDLRVVHLRPTGTADGVLRDLAKNGRANYVCGYHPLYLAAKVTKRVFRRPVLVGALSLVYGYLRARWERQERVRDRGFVRYLRRQQLKRLLGQPTIWR